MNLCLNFTVEPLEEGIFGIDTPPLHVWSYLVVGRDRALLIDTGLGFGSLKAVVSTLTSLPVTVVNTHGHPDHCGGNWEFPACYMSPVDMGVFRETCSYESRYAELSRLNLDGLTEKLQKSPAEPMPLMDKIDLGGRTLDVISTPGHTKGSVCLFDAMSGVLFAGDTVQAEATALLERAAASVGEYRGALLRLSELPVRSIYAGHAPNRVNPVCIRKKIVCADRILSGEKGEYLHTRRGEGYVVSEGGTSIHYALHKGVVSFEEN